MYEKDPLSAKIVSAMARLMVAKDEPDQAVGLYRHAIWLQSWQAQDTLFTHLALAEVLLADPEKALRDVWHLAGKPWTVERMVEMRFQNREAVDPDRLRSYAERFESPRLLRAADVWLELSRSEQEGTLEL